MDPLKLMSMYVAYLRALYLVHQMSHWKTKGGNFYGNHLLFQRIYEAAQSSADEAAEKTIGLFGDLQDEPEQLAKLVKKFSSGEPISNSLNAEKEFQEVSKKLYDSLKKSDDMTLGLDDMLMAIASKHEVHLYLLQQSDK